MSTAEGPVAVGRGRRALLRVRAGTWRLEAAVLLGAFAASILAGVLAVGLVGVSPGDAISSLFQNAAGSKAAFADSLVYAAPRLLVALGTAVAIRCGVFNLGGEGQLQMGAVGATIVGTASLGWLGGGQVILALLCAAAFGAVWAGIAAILKVWRGADEVIVTLMMSFIAVYFVQYLVQGPLQPADSVASTSARVAHSAELPVVIPGTRLHLGFVLGLVTAVGVWWLLYRTRLGLQMRATGLNPRAARVQGLPGGRLVVVSMLISGGIAALAGAGEVLGVQFRLIDGFSENIGFEGLAIAFLGGLEPWAICIVAVYFGMVRNGAVGLELDLGVPAAIAYIMEALPIIFLAAARGWLVLRGRASA